MADTKRQIIAQSALLLLLILLPWIAGLLRMPDLISLGSQVVIYALAAAGLNLLIGGTGLSSFGHAAFFGLGGYVVGIAAFHAADGSLFLGLLPGATDAWIVWPIAFLVAAVAAAVIGALSLRTTGVSFIMITLAFAQMLYYLFAALKIYGGDDGLSFRRRNTIPWMNPRDDVGFYFVCLIGFVAVTVLLRAVNRSRFGMVLHGIRQSERRMAAIGVHTYRYKLAAFTIAGAIAGFAGAMQANLLRFVSPDMLHWTMSGDFIAMVVLGGMGALPGPLLGAAVMVLLQSWLAQWTEHWMIIMGPMLVAVPLLARRGLWGAIGGR